MNGISAYSALMAIHNELYMALNNGALVVGQKVDAMDREHVEKAAIIVKQLMEANRPYQHHL